MSPEYVALIYQSDVLVLLGVGPLHSDTSSARYWSKEHVSSQSCYLTIKPGNV